MLPNMRNFSSRRRRMSGGADESLAQGKNFAANMPGQMRQMGGGNVYHGAPVLAGGDAMLLEGDLRGQALMGPLDASTGAIRGMQDGGSRRRRRNNNMRRSRGRNNNMRRSRRGRNNGSMRRNRGRNNGSMRRSRGRNNASMRRNRGSRRNNLMYGGEGEDYLPEYENAVTPLERRRNNMYGGSHNLLPTEYASVNQSPALISGAAAARAGTAFSNDPFANGSGSA